MEFSVGDRVKLIKEVSHYSTGQVGTVVGVGAYIDVEFDEQPSDVQYVSCERSELAKVAVKVEGVDAIRDSWIQWLRNASDEDVLKFHQNVRDMLSEDDGEQEVLDRVEDIMQRGFARNPIYDRPPQHGIGYYQVVNAWLKSRGFEAEPDQIIDQMDLPDDIRKQAEKAEITPTA
jgi:hypothetical protein